MSDSLHQPLNKSIKESVDPSLPSHSLDPSRASVNPEVLTESMLSVDIDTSNNLLKRYKIISGVGLCFLIFGLILFLVLPPLIHQQVVKGAIEQSVLSADNQDFWAHFPGGSNTVITRNFSFFNLLNEEGMLLHGEIPKFQEIEGYIVQELEDYLNITYSSDGAYVKMKDWLHFSTHETSKDLQQKLKPINAPSVGYWYTLKNSRDPLVFIEGFSLLFNNIEASIVETVLGQGVSAQYLPDYKTAYLSLLQPAGVTQQNSHFIWTDYAYGLGDKDNLKYWVAAAQTSFTDKSPSFSVDALNLKDYFTLSDGEMTSILGGFKEYIQSLQQLIFQNHYCQNVTDFPCDGRELAVRQMASSYITQDTPPVSSITPTDTICTDNATCNGFYPEISSYYSNVYMKEHPESDPFLTFPVEMVRKWLDYNPDRIKGEYNRAESALLHVGNLDSLFSNGSCFDNGSLPLEERNMCFSNIQKRFELPTANHGKVFWGWVKYLMNSLLRQGTTGNQFLGIGTIFTSGLYSSFSFLQDNLQETLLRSMLKKKLASSTCQDFIKKSLQSEASATVSAVCNEFGQNVDSDRFIALGINVCRNKFGLQWESFKKLGVTSIQIESFCDSDNIGSFGQLYHLMRVQINDFYDCSQTPTRYCSDYELALKQWANGSVTLQQPPSAQGSLNSSSTFADWNKAAQPFEYYHYTQKFSGKVFPTFDTEAAYLLFNFDHYFSAAHVIGAFKDPKTPVLLKDYMRYVCIFVGLRGFTHERTARELIFGYNDEYLLERKNNYPPFGGDPSTPAYIAFNDLNVTEEEVVLELEWHTGKADSLMTSQYRNSNGLPYLTVNTSKFNGNESYWSLDNPWADTDYFYGTSGKQFSPDQSNSKNISIYIPNLQRYGSGSLNESYPYQRYGYDLSIAYLGRYIYESGDEFPDNQKYYQKYFGVFNETSVVGFPLFMTKHHFMNCSEEWKSAVEVYSEDGHRFTETSHWDDSYVIVEPYSGVSFQSVLYLQGNYFYQPDNLFTYNRTSMLPIFSLYRSGNLTQEKADELFQPLVFALSLKTALFYIGMFSSIAGAVSFGFGFTKKKQLEKQMRGEKKKKKLSMSLQKKEAQNRQKQSGSKKKKNEREGEESEMLEEKGEREEGEQGVQE